MCLVSSPILTVVLLAAPSNIIITPAWDSGVYYINNTFNCTANGFPLPTVTWTPITSGLSTPPPASGQANGYSLLTITDDSINNQTWMCSVSNVYGSTSKTISISGKIQWKTDFFEALVTLSNVILF